MKKEGKWEADIGLSLACCFKPKEKKLIMKLFEASLDRVISETKKSHEVVLVCWWKNIGGRPYNEQEEWKIIAKARDKLNKERKPYGAGVVVEVEEAKKG